MALALRIPLVACASAYAAPASRAARTAQAAPVARAALSLSSARAIGGSRNAFAAGAPLAAGFQSTARRGNVMTSASGDQDWPAVIKEKNAENKVIVYSKSWCPFCSQVKAVFNKLEVEAKVIELDQINEEQDVQAGLYELTGQRTVPSVFVNEEHIGGCDDTVMALRSGALGEKLTAAGVSFTPFEV